MARGEWCARHDRYFGNVVPCEDCQRELRERTLDEQFRIVSHEPPISLAYLQRLVKSGWRLEVDADSHWDGKFHAQIYDDKRGSGHHHLGASISEAIAGLDRYVAEHERPPTIAEQGQREGAH